MWCCWLLLRKRLSWRTTFTFFRLLLAEIGVLLTQLFGVHQRAAPGSKREKYHRAIIVQRWLASSMDASCWEATILLALRCRQVAIQVDSSFFTSCRPVDTGSEPFSSTFMVHRKKKSWTVNEVCLTEACGALWKLHNCNYSSWRFKTELLLAREDLSWNKLKFLTGLSR